MGGGQQLTTENLMQQHEITKIMNDSGQTWKQNFSSFSENGSQILHKTMFQVDVLLFTLFQKFRNTPA